MSYEQKIEELIAALGKGEWHPSGSGIDGQAKSIDALIKFGDAAIPQILAALSHENEKIRFGVVVALGWTRREISLGHHPEDSDENETAAHPAPPSTLTLPFA